jgi:hypothetical protein
MSSMTLALDARPAAPRWRAALARPDRAIIGPRADALFIWGAPLWGLATILAFMALPGAQTEVGYGKTTTGLAFIVAALSAAHLAPVFVRSHLNPQIFAAHRIKFTLVPPLLFLALATSHWAFVVAGVISIFWDVYHTAQQNFGLARIYDSKSGDAAGRTRTLDRLLCHVMYIGPIMAGASFAEHLQSLTDMRSVGLAAFSALPQAAEGHAATIRLVAIAAMTLACVGYVIAQWRLSRTGYAPSPHKIALMVGTTVVQIAAWGFCPPAIAFMAVNLYHAVQYFAIVWRQEGGKAAGHLNVTAKDFARPLAIALIFVLPILYGLYATAAPYRWNLLGAALLSVTLLHFWMDGFIWSVRKKTV